jgi:hypothetical protein
LIAYKPMMGLPHVLAVATTLVVSAHAAHWPTHAVQRPVYKRQIDIEVGATTLPETTVPGQTIPGETLPPKDSPDIPGDVTLTTSEAVPAVPIDTTSSATVPGADQAASIARTQTPVYQYRLRKVSQGQLNLF